MASRSRGSLVVLGAGGHAKVVISTVRAAGYDVVAVLDDAPGTWSSQILGAAVRGPISSVSEYAGAAAVIAVGSNAARERIAGLVGEQAFATVIHPSAVIDSSVTLGLGTVVFAGAVIQPDSVIGRHVIINTSATVDHDCMLEDFVHIGPGVHLAGAVRLRHGSFLGIGSSVIPEREIGARAIVGAGSVVIRDVAPGDTVGGVPARALRRG